MFEDIYGSQLEGLFTHGAMVGLEVGRVYWLGSEVLFSNCVEREKLNTVEYKVSILLHVDQIKVTS